MKKNIMRNLKIIKNSLFSLATVCLLLGADLASATLITPAQLRMLEACVEPGEQEYDTCFSDSEDALFCGRKAEPLLKKCQVILDSLQR
jgi:hypothetical protein